MSVINQVLNRLEQRGEQTAAEQTMVRAVPPTRRSATVPLLAILLLAVAFAGWQYLYKPEAPQHALPHAAPAVVAAPPPAVAPAADQKTELAAEEGLSPEGGMRELLPPASRLSIELAAVPLPPAKPLATDIALPKLAAAPKPVAEPRAKPAQAKPVPDAVKPTSEMPLKQISPAQQAEAEFRKAAALMQQGRIADAIGGYEAALKLDAGHRAARQALVALLLEGKRNADAERVLHEGLAVRPESGFAMLLARVQVDRDASGEALATLEKFLPQAGAQADYHAFMAALLQRQDRHDDALGHYRIALQQTPGNGLWLMGYGISLQALQRGAEAKEAFRRALESGMLTPELQAFVRQKMGSEK